MGPVWAFSMCMSSSLGIHIVVHLPAKFRPNRTIPDIAMMYYPFFQDGGHSVAILFSVSSFVT